MSTKKDERPPGTTLEGMIWNANQVLEQALEPKVNGIPLSFFEVSIGLVIAECNFKLTGNVGTGILFKKQPKTGGSTDIYSKWSAPSAVGITGLGYGVKDIIIVFIMDYSALDSVCNNNRGYKLPTQSATTLGPLGRSYEIDAKRGVSNTICIAFSKGTFVGINVRGAVVSVRDKVNATFYQTPNISVNEIADVPHDEILKQKIDDKAQLHLLKDVYYKLKQVEYIYIERSLTQSATQIQNTADLTKKVNDNHIKEMKKVDRKTNNYMRIGSGLGIGLGL